LNARENNISNSIYLPTACLTRCIIVGLNFSNSVDSLLDDDPLVAVLASSSSDRSG